MHAHTHARAQENTDYTKTEFTYNLNRKQTDWRQRKTAARNGKYGRSVVLGENKFLEI